jgi:pyrroline-5-carboxylate reductase
MPNELEDRNWGFIGSGRISSVIIERLIEVKALVPEQVLASDLDPGQVQQLVDRFAISAASSNAEVVERSDIVVLAVPPKEVLPVLREIKAFFGGDHLIVSVAAAIPTLAIEEAVEKALPVVRVIPNIPSLVGAGMNPFCLGRYVGESDLRRVERLLEVLGDSEKVDEADMPIMTALTAMGPTYVLPVLQALIDTAVDCGLSADRARELAARTFHGTAGLVLETQRSPRELRKLIPAKTGHDSAVAAIYTDTLTKIFEGVRAKEAVFHSSGVALGTD